MNRVKKSLILLLITILTIFICMPKSKAASLSITLSKTTANVGDTVNITINGNGIAGKISLSVSGNATLNQNSLWVDNSSATASVKINGTGNVTITATPIDASDSTTAQPFTTSASKTITVSSNSSNNSEGNQTTQKPQTKSNVATLSNLGIKPNDFKGFKSSQTSYSVEVPNNVETIEIYASKGQNGQKISGTGKKNLKEGANSFNIVVTAEDGKTQKTYTINVTRKQENEETEQEIPENPEEEQPEENIQETPLEEKIGLTELKIEGVDIIPEFKPDVYEYRIEINEDIEKLDISAITDNTNYNIEITGNENLQEGENVITIIVKDENTEDVTTYQIIVNKIINKNNNIEKLWLENKNIIILISGGIIFLIILCLIIRKIKIAKEDKNSYVSYENIIDNYIEDVHNKKFANNSNDDDTEQEEQEETETKIKIDDLYNDIDDTPRRKRTKGKRFK